MFRLGPCTPAVTLAITLAAGLGCKSAVVPQLTSSGSMALATVAVAGKQTQKLFLPQAALDGNNLPTIAVLDATYDGSGTPLLDTIELSGNADGNPASAVAASPTVVVAVGVSSAYVAFIDPVADKLSATVELPPAVLTPAGGPATFSGSNTLVQGVVIDSANGRALIATAAGFLPVDLTSHAFGTFVPAVPSENFGFWPSKGWLLAPFYLCSACASPAGFQIVDVTAGQVYLLASAGGVGVQPAATDIDPLTEVAVVPDQSAGTVYTLNLSEAELDSDAGTFTAPIGKAPASLSSGSYSGVAIDQVNHQALLEEAGGIGVAIVALPQALGDGGVDPTKAATATMPNPPDGSGWTNAADPHGVAVAVGLASGNPEGFLANADNSQVARIDLDGFASAGSGAVSAADFSGLVTFIPAHN